MADFMMGYNNFGDLSSLSLGSWAIPLTRLRNPFRGVFSKSTDATLASTKFGINFGSSKSLRLIGVLGTNLIGADLYKVTRYSDNLSTAVDDTGWLPVPGYPAYDPWVAYGATRGYDLFHIYDEPTDAFSLKWEFDISTNPAGFMIAGRQFHGDTWIPPYNFGPGNNEGEDVYTEEDESLGGNEYFVVRPPKRRLKLPWEIFQDTENPTLRRIRAYSGTHNQVLAVPDPDDVANYNHRNFLAYMKTPLEIALLQASLASTAVELREAR